MRQYGYTVRTCDGQVATVRKQAFNDEHALKIAKPLRRGLAGRMTSLLISGEYDHLAYWTCDRGWLFKDG